MWRGIEVGHVFKLGTKYSKALNATYLDADGKEQIIFMGCYGIGIGRTVAAASSRTTTKTASSSRSRLRPFTVRLGAQHQGCRCHGRCRRYLSSSRRIGVEVLLDDRDERPGIKFKDADLIGIPLRIVVGSKGLAEGKVELKIRSTGEVLSLSLEEVATSVKQLIDAALAQSE